MMFDQKEWLHSAAKFIKKLQKKLSTTHIIALGFFAAILIGTLLLHLPFASADRSGTPLIDCLFTATTSVCVTGLVTVNTAAHWSLFGKIIILFLIQLGGLGIISFTTGIMMVIGRRITLKDRILLEDAFNLNTLRGLVVFLKRVFSGTFFVEGFGALGYAFVFVPKYGLIKGIWYSVFHSVSAFCNAGIDLLGDNSLGDYLTHPWINLVTMALIIMGGLGFIVWWDISRIISGRRSGQIPKGHALRRLHLHSKIVFITTAVLLLFGWVSVFLLEYSNPDTIGTLTLPQKLLASLFQSVTTRTAGFLTFSQSGLRDSTVLICLMLMFIGGSSIGTAGGIKTTTIALLFLSARATVQGSDQVVVGHRTVPQHTVQKALAVTLVSLAVLILAIISLSIVQDGSLIDIAYETTSAIATVGLSRDFTSRLQFSGKCIIILCMYLGRIGPISLAIFFNARKKRTLNTYPIEDITVG
ncbi:MAG: potassium transporter KtrB [Ruminococcus flavefaciens]|nr:potassium transporter KtrB [Ruminococcus flavefaciens]